MIVADARPLIVLARITRLELPSAHVAYGHGYVSDDGMLLVRKLEFDVAAWCDVDPQGIRMVGDRQ